MKKKILITAGVITIIILLLTILQGKVNAATLQSNPNTHYKTKGNDTSVWIKNIRAMESSGGAMGLLETVNDDQTFKESSNNIDVHMMRNTEYGAIAILSASGYGNSKNIQNSSIKSTTGNQTGIYYTTTGSTDKTHYEATAGGYSFTGINKKYYDSYDSAKVVKIGDALDLKWQGAGSSRWVEYQFPYILRNYNGYFGYEYANMYAPIYSRGVAVCGTGF